MRCFCFVRTPECSILQIKNPTAKIEVIQDISGIISFFCYRGVAAKFFKSDFFYLSDTPKRNKEGRRITLLEAYRKSVLK
jgi:hypothetical protein